MFCLDDSLHTLVHSAADAARNAYIPYSHYPVGAALRAKDGTVYTGCNVENAAYPEGLCAEAVAIGALANTVRSVLASPHPVRIARQGADNALRNRYVPSIERARHELGLDVWTPLPEAIRLTAEALTA